MIEKGLTPELRACADHAALAGRIRNGDRSAEAELVQLFYERVRLVARARTRDPELARDLAQEVMLAAVSALRAGRLRDGDRLPAFVLGIARNVVNNHFRTSAGRAERERLAVDTTEAVEPPDAIEQQERAAIVRRALARLNTTDRRILMMTLVEGLKPAEIARRLSMSDEVVRARKSRATRKVVEEVNRVTKTSAQPH